MDTAERTRETALDPGTGENGAGPEGAGAPLDTGPEGDPADHAGPERTAARGRPSVHDQELVSAILRESLRPGAFSTILDAILGHVLSQREMALEAKGAIFLVERDSRTLVMACERGLDPHLRAVCAHVPFGHCLCGRAAATGRVIHANGIDSRHETYYHDMRPHGHYCAPIMADGQILGVLTLYVADGHRRDEAEERFVTIVADTLALVVRKHRAEESLQRARDDLERLVDVRTQELRREIAERQSTEAALSESREKYRTVIDTAAEGFWMVDVTGRGVDVNEALCRMLGYRRREIVGRPMVDFAAPPDRARLEDQIIATLWHGRRSFEVALRHKEGRPVFTEFHATVIDDAEGRMAGAFAFVTDMTARKLAEEELKLATARTEAASNAKSAFLASMSHEVRTPLNAIIGFSDAILSGVFGPVGNDRYRTYIEDIHRSGVHLLDLINDILDVAKIEAGRMELHDENVSIATIVESSLRLVAPRAVSNRVTLATDVADLPLIRADERRLKQILLNLLTNAIKFTVGGRVTVGARLDAEGAVILTVSDNGVGMAAEEIVKALEPFSQTRAGMSAREGTGLGLPLTKGLIEAHGGLFSISSAPGDGTTITAVLPSWRVQRRLA